MPEKPSDFELVETNDSAGYPVNWVVNRSDRSIKSLTFWAGSRGFYEKCRHRATAIPPRSYFRSLTQGMDPGRLISAIEEVIWDDGSTQSCFPMPRSTGEHNLTGFVRVDAAVELINEDDCDHAVWDRLCKAIGWT